VLDDVARKMYWGPSAVADCCAALAADPEFDRARLRAGTCLMKLGAFGEAEAAFRLCPAGAYTRSHFSST